MPLLVSRPNSNLRSRFQGSAGQRALLVTFVVIIALGFIFIKVGGVFDKPFWLAFIPGLMSNLIILSVAVFIIDRMFQKERWRKLGQINARKSEFVLLLSNRLAFWLLKYLELATAEESEKDEKMNFEFAIEKLQPKILQDTFFQKLMQSDDRETFLDGFTEKLNSGIKGLSMALGDIYPHPDPEAVKLVDDMQYVSGALDAIKALVQGIAETNKHMDADKQLMPEQVELLLRIASIGPGTTLEKVSHNLVELSNRARSYKLFVSLDW